MRNFSYKDGGLKYSFIIHPGADASLIKLKWSGVDNIAIDTNGNLQLILKWNYYGQTPNLFLCQHRRLKYFIKVFIERKNNSFFIGNL